MKPIVWETLRTNWVKLLKRVQVNGNKKLKEAVNEVGIVERKTIREEVKGMS